MWQSMEELEESDTSSIYGIIRFMQDIDEEKLSLIELLCNEGALEEARLYAIQTQILEDFIKCEPLGKKLFGDIKLETEKIVKRSTSPIALINNLLPLVKNESIYESVNAVDSIYMNLAEAWDDVSGKRKEKLMLGLENLKKDLKKNTHPVLQSYAKLLSSLLQHIKNIDPMLNDQGLV